MSLDMSGSDVSAWHRQILCDFKISIMYKKIMKQKIIWTTAKRSLNDLKPYSHNPRRISQTMFTALKKSISDTGYAEAITVNLDNTIIAGHQRYHALLDIGETEIDVRVPSRMLTEAEVRRYLLASNKITGEWDYDMLVNEFSPDELFETGFSRDDFDLDLKETPESADEDAKDEAEKCPVCGK